jgi:hypothetical protein
MYKLLNFLIFIFKHIQLIPKAVYVNMHFNNSTIQNNYYYMWLMELLIINYYI